MNECISVYTCVFCDLVISITVIQLGCGRLFLTQTQISKLQGGWGRKGTTTALHFPQGGYKEHHTCLLLEWELSNKYQYHGGKWTGGLTRVLDSSNISKQFQKFWA